MSAAELEAIGGADTRETLQDLVCKLISIGRKLRASAQERHRVMYTRAVFQKAVSEPESNDEAKLKSICKHMLKPTDMKADGSGFNKCTIVRRLISSTGNGFATFLVIERVKCA